MLIREKDLRTDFWSLSGSNLLRSGLCGTSTTFFRIDPETINSLGGTKTSQLTSGQISGNLQFATSADVSLIASNLLTSNWTAKGWNTADPGRFKQELKYWIRRNFEDLSATNPSFADGNLLFLQPTIGGNQYTIALLYFGNRGAKVADVFASTNNAESGFLQPYDGSVWMVGNATSGTGGDGTTQGRSSPVAALGGRSYSILSAGVASGSSGTTAAIEGSTGNAYCWGRGSSGQIGDGTIQSRSSPTLVLGNKSFVDISASSLHTAAIEGSTGFAYCWGGGGSGTMGDNGTASHSSPVAVAGGRSYVQVAAQNGPGNTAAIEGSTGFIYCWGPGGSGANGDGTTANRSSPVAIQGGRKYAQISSGGGGFTLFGALEAGTGLAYCWGGFSNIISLGDGTTQNRSSPVAVLGSHKFKKLAMSSGGAFALDASGNLWGWGSMAGGFGDNGVTLPTSSPVMITTGKTWRDIAGGGAQFAVEVGTDIVYGWGDNGNSAIGLGYNTNLVSPAPVITDKTFTQLSTRLGTTVALDTAGLAYDWGNGHSTPIVITSSSGPFSRIESANIAGFGLEASTGVVWGWGTNSSGLLGDGTITNRPGTPAAVLGGRSYVAIGVAQNNACYAIEGSTGNIYAWGNNSNGRLGDNTIQNRSSPVVVVGGRSYKMVTGSSTQAAAIEAATGLAFGWGSGNAGDNTTASRSSPVAVSGGRSYSYIAGGFNQILAIEGSTGIIYGWGNNNGGNLGDGTTSGRSSPVAVQGGRSYIAAAGSLQSSYAIEGSTGYVYAWGAGAQINPDLSTTATSSPVAIPGNRSFVALSSGNVVLAIEGGTNVVWAFGSSAGGSLGNNTDSLIRTPTPIARVFT